MRKTILVLIAIFGIALASTAQDLMVFRVSGKVTKVEGMKSSPLNIKDKVTLSTTINVGYEGMVELLDESNAKRYTIKSPGEGTVAVLSKTGENSIKTLTSQYISYIKNQMTNNTQIVSAQKYTDFATVTRDSAVLKKPAKMTARDRLKQHREEVWERYNAFRRNVNKRYNEFVRKAWDNYHAGAAVPAPQERELPVIEYAPKEEDDNRVYSNIVLSSANTDRVMVAETASFYEQPQPVQPIKEVEPEGEETKFQPMPFSFYGTELFVRLDESKRVNLGKLTTDRIADALDLFNTKGYDNVIYDCLDIRDMYTLCDWAYINMVTAMSEQFCGAGTNEAVLMAGYLLTQTGYKMRFAMASDHLYLLLGSPNIIYNVCAFRIGDTDYYPIDTNAPTELSICPAFMAHEKPLQLDLCPQPKFSMAETAKRTLTAENRKDFSVVCTVNKNLIDFYDSYPVFAASEQTLTRWNMYANAPLDPSIKSQLYPQLNRLLEGLTEKQAVGQLLNWLQRAFPYAYDSQVWGGDRIFFSEETLFYPGCDCEDRAILFTRLVRDLVGLPCALVYYPGHLAAAVHFNEPVKGDTYTCDGESYLVCDPTYIGASMGMQQSGLDYDAAKLILLK